MSLTVVSSSPAAGLAHTVEYAIRAQLGRYADNLKVDAADGIVTLQGQTPSYYQRQLAIHAAQSVAGVDRIKDEVRVATYS